MVSKWIKNRIANLKLWLAFITIPVTATDFITINNVLPMASGHPKYFLPFHTVSPRIQLQTARGLHYMRNMNGKILNRSLSLKKISAPGNLLLPVFLSVTDPIATWPLRWYNLDAYRIWGILLNSGTECNRVVASISVWPPMYFPIDKAISRALYD